MRKYKFYQVDVFAEKQFGGNPLAVFPDAEGLSDSEMQVIAFELNLSETAFVFKSAKPEANHQVRIFTPVMEIPFAGHPTIGTHYILARLKRFPLKQNPTRVMQEVGVGILPVDIYTEHGEIAKITMTQAEPKFLDPIEDLQCLADGLCCDVDDLNLEFARPQVVSTGLPCMIVPVKSLTVLGKLGLEVRSLRTVCERHGCEMAYAFSLETYRAAGTAHARFFSGHLLFEDPATGSAAGALGAFLAKNNVRDSEDASNFVIEQGDFLGRPSRIDVLVEHPGGEPKRVEVSGKCRFVFEAELWLEEN